MSQDGSPPASQAVERRLGAPAVFAICAGAMFSSGFFLLPGLAADETGPSVPLAYALAALLVLPAVASLAELASAMPRAGGPYYFLARALGPLAGTIGALGKYVQLLFKAAFAFVGVGVYLSLVVDVPVQAVAAGLVLLFTAVNLVGAAHSARAEIGLVAVLLALLAYFVVAGGVEVAAEPDVIGERFADAWPFGATGFLAAVAIVFVSFGGVGQVGSLAGEVREPASTIPRGMVLALGSATFFYVVGTALMVALVPADALRDDQAPVATAAAQLTVLPLAVAPVVVAALAAFASTGNAAIMSAARYPLALARDGLLWARFGRVSGRGVPRLSVLVTGALLVGVILAFDVERIAKLASAFLLLVFAGFCVAVIVFRAARQPDYRPGFTSPFYPVTQIAGIGAYVVLIVESGTEAVAMIAGLLVVSSLWYVFQRRGRDTRRTAARALVERLTHRAAGQAEDSDATRLAPPLDEVLARADVVEADHGWRQPAAEALAQRLGCGPDEVAEALRTAEERSSVPAGSRVRLLPVLLEGIEQPEAVLVRSSHAPERAGGLVVLADDARRSTRLAELSASAQALLCRPGVARGWRAAEDSAELRSALVQDRG